MQFFCIFFAKNFDISKKSSTFAAEFEKNRILHFRGAIV